MTGTHVVPVTTVVMEINGREVKKANFGVGPVDAVYNTIFDICQSPATLRQFMINAISEGTDAQGEVAVRLAEDGLTVLGRASHPDILVASARALVDGLNRLEHLKRQPERKGAQL
jgi:2-isopropylmalate synthase